jgi:hypothetical protein
VQIREQLTFVCFHDNWASAERAESLPLSLHHDSTADTKDVLAFHPYGPPGDREADGTKVVIKLWDNLNDILCNL